MFWSNRKFTLFHRFVSSWCMPLNVTQSEWCPSMCVKWIMCAPNRNLDPCLKDETSIYNHFSWQVIPKILLLYIFDFIGINFFRWIHEIFCCRFISESIVWCDLCDSNLDSWVLNYSIGRRDTMTEKQIMTRLDNVKYLIRNIFLVSQSIDIYRSVYRLLNL